MVRRKIGLNFHKPGKFIAEGEQLRKKSKLEALKKKIAEKTAKTGIADAAKLATLTSAPKIASEEKLEAVPDFEWWDNPILGDQTLDSVIIRLNNGAKSEDIFHGITNLVEHPPIKEPPSHGSIVTQTPLYLTKKELKKLRRQNRRVKELEKQELIKLGLMPKPETKLKQSNIMHALGEQAVTNPSLANQLVKEQEEKRLQAHIEHNESKKLSVEEKKQKKLRKIQEDLSLTGVWVTVYRILKLDKQMNKLKTIEQKATQLIMSGVIVLYKNVNLVVVEGGPKQQRKFKQLILNRIRWSEVDPLDIECESDTARRKENQCLLVWEGQVSKKTFNHVRVKQFKSEPEARKHFRDFNVEHYWDLAFKMSILESIDDT